LLKCENSRDFELFNGGTVYFELLMGKPIISSLLTTRAGDLVGENLVMFCYLTVKNEYF